MAFRRNKAVRVVLGKSLRQQLIKYLAKGFSCRGLFRPHNQRPTGGNSRCGAVQRCHQSPGFFCPSALPGATLSLKLQDVCPAPKQRRGPGYFPGPAPSRLLCHLIGQSRTTCPVLNQSLARGDGILRTALD